MIKVTGLLKGSSEGSFFQHENLVLLSFIECPPKGLLRVNLQPKIRSVVDNVEVFTDLPQSVITITCDKNTLQYPNIESGYDRLLKACENAAIEFLQSINPQTQFTQI